MQKCWFFERTRDCSLQGNLWRERVAGTSPVQIVIKCPGAQKAEPILPVSSKTGERPKMGPVGKDKHVSKSLM